MAFHTIRFDHGRISYGNMIPNSPAYEKNNVPLITMPAAINISSAADTMKNHLSDLIVCPV